ncbi:hypothetical protein, partial [Streptomyces muensis]
RGQPAGTIAARLDGDVVAAEFVDSDAVGGRVWGARGGGVAGVGGSSGMWVSSTGAPPRRLRVYGRS